MSLHSAVMYGLSTCIHCRHTREFLEANNVDCRYVYVDLAEGEDRARVLQEVKRYNTRLSFPTLVIDDGSQVIVGFQPEAITEALEL